MTRTASPSHVTVIGGGLAGSEAAWQLAARGVPVRLIEMRPTVMGPAHHTGLLAELVCSNSLKSVDPDTAAGCLKAELRALGSLLLAFAEKHAVPAGAALEDCPALRPEWAWSAYPRIRAPGEANTVTLHREADGAIRLRINGERLGAAPVDVAGTWGVWARVEGGESSRVAWERAEVRGLRAESVR